MKHKIYLALTLLVLGLGLFATANAQNGRMYKGGNWKQRVEDARNGKVEINKESLARVEEAYAEREEVIETLPFGNPTGTWFVTVPGATPAEDFFAYWTFGSDGTFVETSSALATLTEGPAHGAYERTRRGYNLTFELFAFDPETAAAVGRIQVRCAFRLTSNSTLTGDAFAYFIDPDGKIIPLGGGPFSAEKVRVRGL